VPTVFLFIGAKIIHMGATTNRAGALVERVESRVVGSRGMIALDKILLIGLPLNIIPKG